MSELNLHHDQDPEEIGQEIRDMETHEILDFLYTLSESLEYCKDELEFRKENKVMLESEGQIQQIENELRE